MEIIKPSKKVLNYNVSGPKINEVVANGYTANIHKASVRFWNGLFRKPKGTYELINEEVGNILDGYKFLKSAGMRVPSTLRYIKDKGFLVTDLTENNKYIVEDGSQNVPITKNENIISEIENFEEEIDRVMNFMHILLKARKTVPPDLYFFRHLKDHQGAIKLEIFAGDIDAMSIDTSSAKSLDSINRENLQDFSDSVTGWIERNSNYITEDCKSKIRKILKSKIEKYYKSEWSLDNEN